MKLRVECYSGSKADERPVRFRLDDHDYFVEELLDQWYGPDDTYFKVLSQPPPYKGVDTRALTPWRRRESGKERNPRQR